MAVPSYTSDLTVIDLADAITAWAESTDGNWDDGGAPTQETDYFIHNGGTAACVSATATTAKGNHGTLIANYGSGATIPTDGAVLFWVNFLCANVLDSYANGGLKAVIGSDLANFKYWIIGGNNFGKNPYGGWENFAVDPAQTQDGTVGSPTTTLQYFGVAHKITAAVSKGNPFGVDVVRFGRCEARFAGGESANYCTFAGYATVNDAVSARWGLLQAIPGSYLWKGLMTIGYSSAADFRDSNVSILIDDVRKVSSAFNKIEVRQSGSRLDWTNVKFQALGTVSRGSFTMVDAADVNIESCQFIGMDTFTFLSTGDALNTIFRGCNAITMSGAGKLNGSSVLVPTVAADASAVIWNLNTNPDGYLDDMTFSKGTNAHHAIEFGTSSPTSMTVRGWTTSGFNASNGQNDSTFYVARTTGTVTISVVGGSGNFSYKSAGATVVIVQDPVTVAVHAQTILGADIENARVYLQASDGTGPFPFEESVTITNSGTTATVSHTGHGMASGDWVKIEGASHWQNNGAHEITKISDDSYSYTLPSAPGSNPTGTITSTFIALTGLTDANGDKSTSRVYSSDQPVVGWVRLTPTYKTAPLSGSVSSTTGFSATAIMITD